MWARMKCKTRALGKARALPNATQEKLAVVVHVMSSLMRASLNANLVLSARTFAAWSVEIHDIAGIGILNHRLLPIQSVLADCGELHMAVTASRRKRLLQENSVSAKSGARSQHPYEQCGQQWSLDRHYSSLLCVSCPRSPAAYTLLPPPARSLALWLWIAKATFQ